MNKLRKEIDEILLEMFKGQSMEENFRWFQMFLSKVLPKYKPPMNLIDKMEDELEFLECLIEVYTFWLSMCTGEDYEEIDPLEIAKEWKSYRYLAEYKIRKYGVEMMDKIGMEVVDISPEGWIVRDKERQVGHVI